MNLRFDPIGFTIAVDSVPEVPMPYGLTIDNPLLVLDLDDERRVSIIDIMLPGARDIQPLRISPPEDAPRAALIVHDRKDQPPLPVLEYFLSDDQAELLVTIGRQELRSSGCYRLADPLYCYVDDGCLQGFFLRLAELLNTPERVKIWSQT